MKYGDVGFEVQYFTMVLVSDSFDITANDTIKQYVYNYFSF